MKTGMKMCRRCRRGQKERGGYLSGNEQIVKQAECSIHPRLDNWRVLRTLGFFEAMSLEADGHVHSHAKGVRMVITDGWTHLRTAKAVLFDYEVPFIELLLENVYLEHKENDGDPGRVRPTMRGKAWLRERQLEIEAEKKVREQVEAEKATL